MNISILTLFPENFTSFLNTVLVKRAITKGLLTTTIVDIRNYAKGSYRHLDDDVYGGGAGMVLKCEPVIQAISHHKKPNTHTIILDPIGIPYTQQKAHELLTFADIQLVCGHYEGFDARIYEEADEIISIGDYILSGGELGSMVIVDSIVRLLPTVIRQTSTKEESFETPRLEYAQYTKPYDYEGKKVPDILLSGNHQLIQDWRTKSSLLRTLQYRKDLIEKYPLTEEEKKTLERNDI